MKIVSANCLNEGATQTVISKIPQSPITNHLTVNGAVSNTYKEIKKGAFHKNLNTCIVFQNEVILWIPGT